MYILRSLIHLLSNMPRRSAIYRPEPKEWFSCPVHGCFRKFRTQTGRTKHIRAKHKNDELPTRTRNLLSATKTLAPQAPVSESSSDASMPIESNHDRQDVDMPDVPRSGTPDLASDFSFLDRTNITRSPIPSNNDPASPLPFQPEIENRHHDDQAPEQVFVSSTIYHSYINGMTLT